VTFNVISVPMRSIIVYKWGICPGYLAYLWPCVAESSTGASASATHSFPTLKRTSSSSSFLCALLLLLIDTPILVGLIIKKKSLYSLQPMCHDDGLTTFTYSSYIKNNNFLLLSNCFLIPSLCLCSRAKALLTVGQFFKCNITK
jgi:hypothetical protein